MKPILNSVLFILIIIYFSSCTASKKVDFVTAYKFSRYNYQNSENDKRINNNGPLVSDELYVSKEIIKPKKSNWKRVEIEQNILDRIGIAKEDEKEMETEFLAKKINQMSRMEKKAFRRELKKELKQLKNPDLENSYSTNESNETNELTDYMRWSIVVGSAGLVLLILGAIFSVGFLSTIGAIAIVGGLVLFILDQV